MNAISKLILVIFLFTLPSVYSLNICSVDLQEPWFAVEDGFGNPILIIDSEGDAFFRGEDHTLNNYNSQKTFKVSNSVFFNSQTSKYSNIEQLDSSLPESSGVKIRNSDGTYVAVLSETDVNLAGYGAYEGSQAACAPDGLYCNGGTVENRNYYCDITGNSAGICTYSVSGSTNCLTIPTTETDGGNNVWTYGTVTDTDGCTSGACTTTTYADACTSGTNLREYFTSGSSYSSTVYSCSSNDYTYCSGGNVYTQTYTCGSGKCQAGSAVFTESCSAPGTSYSSWSCSDGNTRVRTITTYSPYCSGGACGYSSSPTYDYDDCSSGQYCSGGSCYYTYSWETGSWGSCSANPYWGGWEACSNSCGSGTQSRTCYGTSGIQSRSVWCERSDGAVVSDSYCDGGAPAHQQFCSESCSGSSSQSCYSESGCSSCPYVSSGGCHGGPASHGSSGGSCMSGYTGSCSAYCDDGNWVSFSNACYVEVSYSWQYDISWCDVPGTTTLPRCPGSSSCSSPGAICVETYVDTLGGDCPTGWEERIISYRCG